MQQDNKLLSKQKQLVKQLLKQLVQMKAYLNILEIRKLMIKVHITMIQKYLTQVKTMQQLMNQNHNQEKLLSMMVLIQMKYQVYKVEKHHQRQLLQLNQLLRQQLQHNRQQQRQQHNQRQLLQQHKLQLQQLLLKLFVQFQLKKLKDV